MKKCALVCLILGVVSVLPLAASADTFTYSFSNLAQNVAGGGLVSLGFDLTLTATPISDGEFGVTEIASSDFTVNGVTLPSFDELVTYSPTGDRLFPTGFINSSLMYYDNLYFSSSPNFDGNGISFTDGNVDVVVYNNGNPSDSALFTVAATPEPSSWLLALSGLVGILGLAFYRRNAVWNN